MKSIQPLLLKQNPINTEVDSDKQATAIPSPELQTYLHLLSRLMAKAWINENNSDHDPKEVDTKKIAMET